MWLADKAAEFFSHLVPDFLLVGSDDLKIVYFPFQIHQVEAAAFYIRDHVEHFLGDEDRCYIIHIGIFFEQFILGKAQAGATKKQDQEYIL